MRVSRAARERLLGAYRASGLTQEQFAAQSGIKLGTRRTWIDKGRTPVVADRGRFAPVRIVDGSRPATNSRGSVTVRWPQGIEVEIAVDLDRAGVTRSAQTSGAMFAIGSATQIVLATGATDLRKGCNVAVALPVRTARAH